MTPVLIGGLVALYALAHLAVSYWPCRHPEWIERGDTRYCTRCPHKERLRDGDWPTGGEG